MKKINLYSAVLNLFLLVPASITWAQTISTQKGLTTVSFNTGQGQIKVYLPDDIRPGDMISGKITLQPSGKNSRQSEINRKALAIYKISLLNERIPVVNNDSLFRIKIPEGKPMPLRVMLTDGEGINKEVITIKSIPENEQLSSVDGCSLPSHTLAGSPFPINGPFDGDASNTRCSLDSKALDILAESPRECIVSWPAGATGPHLINYNESDKPPCKKQVTGVEMKIAAGKLSLQRGQSTYIDVTISHLEQMKDSAYFTLINESAGVISITGGNTITVAVPPPSGNSDGIYTRRFDVQSIRTGSFTVNAVLNLPEVSGNTESENASANPSPVKKDKLRLPVSGNDISIWYDNKLAETKSGETEHIHVMGNTVRIFLNGVFENEFDIVNEGETTLQDLLTVYSDAGYPPPLIDCDSLGRICNKNRAFNVFWGNVYSVSDGRENSRQVNGETREAASQNSLLITRGWEIDCCTGEYSLKLFFQAMNGNGGAGSYSVSFSKTLKTGKPCPVDCLPCKNKCEEFKKLVEEAKEKMRKEKR